jgi:putative membrane protein
MNLFALILTLLIGAQHLAFCALEMFFWTKPIGLKIFGQTPALAESSKALAANQGLYNFFLAAGLVLAALTTSTQGLLFLRFFLACVVAAGIFGALTVKPRIFYVQSVPALLAIALTFF